MIAQKALAEMLESSHPTKRDYEKAVDRKKKSKQLEKLHATLDKGRLHYKQKKNLQPFSLKMSHIMPYINKQGCEQINQLISKLLFATMPPSIMTPFEIIHLKLIVLAVNWS